MTTINELIMNQQAISEIVAIKSNVLLSFQVLLIIGLLDSGVTPKVKISVKKESIFDGEIYMCSGHSFLVGNLGYAGNVCFTDIDYLELMSEV